MAQPSAHKTGALQPHKSGANVTALYPAHLRLLTGVRAMYLIYHSLQLR
jgi:hypothetical protein